MAAVRKMEVFAALGGRSSGPPVFLLCQVLLFLLIPFGAETGLSLSKKCGDLICLPSEYCSQFDKRCQGCDSVCEKSSHNFQEDVCHRDCQDYLHDRRYARIDGERIDGDVGKLNEAVFRLTQLATASLAISAILLFACAVFVCFMWFRTRVLPDDSEVGGQEGGNVASFLHSKITSNKSPFKSDKSASTAVSTNSTANSLKLDIAAAVAQNPAQQQGNSRQTPQPQAPPPPERMPASTPTTAGGRSEATDAYSPATTTSTILSGRPPRYPSEDTTLDYAYDNRALTPSPRLEKESKGNGTAYQHPPTPYHHPQQMGVKGETTF